MVCPIRAGVAELVDARDLKSRVPKGACGFDPRPRHHPERAGPGASRHASTPSLTGPEGWPSLAVVYTDS